MPDGFFFIWRILICIVPLLIIAGATIAYLFFTRPRLPEDRQIRNAILRFRKKNPKASEDNVIDAVVNRYSEEFEERSGLGPAGGPAGMLGAALGNSFNRGKTNHFNNQLRARVEEVFDRMNKNNDDDRS